MGFDQTAPIRWRAVTWSCVYRRQLVKAKISVNTNFLLGKLTTMGCSDEIQTTLSVWIDDGGEETVRDDG